MSPFEILSKAQDLIRSPDHWAIESYAYDANGTRVEPNATEATCWCSLGAIQKILDQDDGLAEHVTFDLLGKAIDNPKTGAVPDFNDTHTHAEVMVMFDRAKELARAAT